MALSSPTSAARSAKRLIPSSPPPPSLEESSQSATSVEEEKTPRRKTASPTAAASSPSSSSSSPSKTKLLPPSSSSSSPMSQAMQQFMNGSVLTPPAVRRQNEREQPKFNMILDTMTGLKDTYQGIKEWARSPRGHNCDNTGAVRDTIDDMNGWYQPNNNNNNNSASASTAPTTNVSQSPLVQTPPRRSLHETSRASAQPKDARQHDSLLQDLAWPFFACVSTSTQRKTPVSAVKSKKGVLTVPADRRTESFGGESIITIDTFALLDEEARQLQRLTSWGTDGTFGTIESVMTDRTKDTQTTTTVASSIHSGEVILRSVLVEDDDGNLIHPVLLEQAHKRQTQRRGGGRKRLVKFDYPPISSLRECPRVDPQDLGKLFFTEEELEQMEEDRFSTLTADDVEIVAVGSPESDVSSVSPTTSFSNYKASPRHRKQNGPPDFRLPEGVEFEEASPDDSIKPQLRQRPKRPPTPRNPAKRTAPEPHLIRGVQIYLRERSTPC